MMKHNLRRSLSKAGAVILASLLMTVPGAAAGCNLRNTPLPNSGCAASRTSLCLADPSNNRIISDAIEQIRDQIKTGEKKETASCHTAAQAEKKSNQQTVPENIEDKQEKQAEKAAEDKNIECLTDKEICDLLTTSGEKTCAPSENKTICTKNTAEELKRVICGIDLGALIEKAITDKSAGNDTDIANIGNFYDALQKAWQMRQNKEKNDHSESADKEHNESVEPPKENTKEEAHNDSTAEQTVSQYEAEVVRLVNEIRRQNGLNELRLNTKLSSVARLKSADMKAKGYFDHQSPTYGSPFDMMKQYGITYRSAGENIAMGYPSPRSVVDGWMNSPGHRANILKDSFTEIGVGYYADGNYWTQMFIG